MSEIKPSWLLDSASGVVDEVVISSGQLKSQACRQLYEWWLGFSPKLPVRTQIRLEQLSKILPKIYLSQLVDDIRFEVRIQGERVKELIGQGHFPQSFSVDDGGFSGKMAINYREAIRRGCVLRHSGDLDVIGRGHMGFESVDVPVLGDNGGGPYILGVICES